MATTSHPKLVLYTNHGCPFCHRVHIVLNELGIEVEEHLIDLDTPRPQWYLDINPKGSVPTLQFSLSRSEKTETITESAVVAKFLCDAFPSHLLPATSKGDLKAALIRARINTVVDTWLSKVAGKWFGILMAPTLADKEAKVDEYVATVTKELEPLLADSKPFVAGSEKMTYVEAIAGPDLVRISTLSKDGEMIPASLAEKLDALPNFGAWAKAVREEESVTKSFDAEQVLAAMRKFVAKVKGGK